MSAVAAPLPISVDLCLPEYEDDEAHPLPLYSQTIGSSECLLQTVAQRRTGCPACEWIFPTKHLRINLGRRQWKINGPAYGLNSTIDGSVTAIHKQHQLEGITATFEGRLKTSTPERIPATDDSSVPFLSFTVPIYKAGEQELSDDEIPFSIPIPSRLRYKGEETLCPPSFYYSDLHFMCEISYSIRFDVSIKTKFRRTDSRTIPIYYLPKTNPVIPPLCVLPPASRHLENPPLFLSGSDRMESFPLVPSFRSKGTNLALEKLSASQRHKLEEFKSSVYLSIPVPSTFTAGQDIPFMISLSFPSSPHLASLLSSTPEVQLLKRVGVYRKSAPGDIRPVAERCTLISTATIRRTSGWAEGMVVLKGDIQAGDAGCESSWVLRDAAHVQFFLRIALHPPPSLTKHIPTYVHEEPIELCTSSWGSLEREMASSGGVTTPAVSLTANLRKLY